MLPLSGKNGFMVGRGSTGSPTVLHIYSWQFFHRQVLQQYRTSRSGNYPVGTNGVIDELLVIRGANLSITDYLNTITNSASVEFDLGWYNLAAGVKYSSLVKGMLREIRYDFIYSKTSSPSVTWTAQFVGVETDRSIVTSALGFNGDSVFCPPTACTYAITRNDVALDHIRSSSLIATIERQTYRTSRSNEKPVSTLGVPDAKATLVIEGDFDYWLNEIVTGGVAGAYDFFYGLGVGESLGGLLMKVSSIDNLHVNVQTGEIVSATVTLEAAYG